MALPVYERHRGAVHAPATFVFKPDAVVAEWLRENTEPSGYEAIRLTERARLAQAERGLVLVGFRGHVWKGRTCRAVCPPPLFAEERRSDGVMGGVCYQNFSLRNARVARQHLASGEHSCGVYLRNEPDPCWVTVPELMLPTVCVIAEVVAWGQVTHYSEGARAEAVRIERIWNCPRELALYRGLNVHAALQRRYRVPVSSEMAPAYPVEVVRAAHEAALFVAAQYELVHQPPKHADCSVSSRVRKVC
jgi:hypothetical protein